MTPLDILDVIDGIVDDTHPEGDGCPLCVALTDLRAVLVAPSTPEPSGPAEQALIRAANAPSVTEPDRLAVPHFRDTEAIWKAIEPFVRLAPPTEPALDAERWALATVNVHAPWYHGHPDSQTLREAVETTTIIAAEYARLAESQP